MKKSRLNSILIVKTFQNINDYENDENKQLINDLNNKFQISNLFFFNSQIISKKNFRVSFVVLKFHKQSSNIYENINMIQKLKKS